MDDEMEEPTLLAKLNAGGSIPLNSCRCGHCHNEWYIAALSDEWMPSYCPYCGIAFLRSETGDVPSDFRRRDALEDVVCERDAAEASADELASLVLGEPIDWSDHQDAWRRAVEKLEQQQP